MRHAWLFLAGFLIALLIARPAAAQISSGIGDPSFNLAEAYPGTAGSYGAESGIADPQLFAGRCPGTPLACAVPGVLCLQRRGLVLDVNCFAVVPGGQVGPCTVQSYRLIITVPGSQECPDVYGAGGHTYFQFGSGVRTWWCLSFSPPGTVFALQVVSVCWLPLPDGRMAPRIHQDGWSWQVVADVHTLACLIELMHAGAVSNLEVPCILGEDAYDALKAARDRLERALAVPDDPAHTRLTEIGNALIDFEALIVSNCLFVEVLKPLDAFRGADQFGAPAIQPPGNAAPTVPLGASGTAVAGIIDTTEHPCCCKLLVDLEWIAGGV